jgi:peptidoglycan/xylan/chitin deacetylase (PgdA/CDA1 family)
MDQKRRLKKLKRIMTAAIAMAGSVLIASSGVSLPAYAAANRIGNPTPTSATVSSGTPDGWVTGARGNAAGAVFSYPASTIITTPNDAAAARVSHSPASTETLSAANHSPTLSTPPDPSFPQGMVSLTFDDGWESQYTNGFPILKSANMPGSFYIITNAMAVAAGSNPNILCSDPKVPYCDGAQIAPTISSWTASGQYPDPTFPGPYEFSETYTASAPVTVTVSYFRGPGTPIAGGQNLGIATLPAGNARAGSAPFTIPSAVFSLVSTSSSAVNPFFTISESVPSGETLQVEHPSLLEQNSADTYMTTAQVRQMQAAGEEIGAHTLDHCDLVMLQNNSSSAATGGASGPPAGACASQLAGPTTAAQEIDGSRAALLANGISPADTFAYPYGDYNAAVEGLVKNDGFIGARTVAAGYNTRTTDPYALQTQIIDESTTFAPNALARVEGWINTAVATKSWLVLLFHNVEPADILTQNRDVDGTTPDFLQSIVDYLKSQHVCVVTMHRGLQAMGTSSVDPCSGRTPPPPSSAHVHSGIGH